MSQLFNFLLWKGKEPYWQITRMIECDVLGPVDYRWKDRISSCKAIVLPEGCEPLFGAIPMEDMDIYVHPTSGQLIGHHPDYPIMRL